MQGVDDVHHRPRKHHRDDGERGQDGLGCPLGLGRLDEGEADAHEAGDRRQREEHIGDSARLVGPRRQRRRRVAVEAPHGEERPDHDDRAQHAPADHDRRLPRGEGHGHHERPEA